MIKEAVILAGGLGTRLRDKVADLPKSMAPVNGKPFLAYLLDYLSVNGIERVVLSVGYMNEKISDYFQQAYNGIDIIYSIENEPLGTGGAVLLATEHVRSENFYILNGDTIFDIDLLSFAEFHQKNRSDISLALRQVENAGRYGTVILNGHNRIIDFREKDDSVADGLINGGVYIVDKHVFNTLSFSPKFSLEKDCFEKYCNSLEIFGSIYSDYFLDIGIPEDYNKAQNEFKKFENR